MSPLFERVVPDTNLLVSAFFYPGSLPSLCLATVQRSALLLASVDTLAELTEVLLRPKFDRHLSRKERIQWLVDFSDTLTIVEISERVQECHDPKDDKFLELAVSGKADLILSGDRHLLVMNPWRKIPIMTPGSYLAL